MAKPSRQWQIYMFTAFAALTLAASVSAKRSAPADDAQQRLELRLASPLRWENGCLVVSLDRINRSLAPLFLTKMGPYAAVALDVSTTSDNSKQVIEWINLYGGSDIIDLSTTSLAPGATLHQEFCLGPVVWVVNQKKETRRQIPVRGKLQITATYYFTEDAAQQYQAWFDAPHTNESAASTQPPAEATPMEAKLLAAIPCTETNCSPSCTQPPKGISGEFRAVPDVFFIELEWAERGKVLTNDLARMAPPCPEDKSNSK
jgi:hypothetical protein